ncbi:hypothetical protein PR202_gb22006 [Eleusine coracana subsp. coracana]|uniref:Pectinesterase inhibitor domain-containing protein n=1 Tax=Eleusine coracana subsp. coracana TaxID=191504 RepID=A0AAV5FF59_ELECO|nr:hypothetical protein PR202_gb22006 [Eleusine coracana subsp. coracana]
MPLPAAARAKKAAAIFSVLVLLLLLGVLSSEKKALFAVAATSNGNNANYFNAAAAMAAEHEAAVERHCAGTLHRDVCRSTLSSIPDLAQKPLRSVISDVVSRAAAAVRASSSNCSSYLARPRALRVRDRLALADCLELFGHTLAQLGAAAAGLSSESVADVQTVLSAALTNQYTCLDGFSGPSASEDGRVRPFVQGRIYHAAHLQQRRLLLAGKEEDAIVLEGYGRVRRGFPAWVNAADRRRLQQQQQQGGVAANAVVAKDGSGDFRTVGDAVAAAPNNSATRYVIYIKAGGYFENVEVGSEKTNIMFVGDGMWKTVIKASRNVVDNSTTFRSATLAVVGMGFLARDLTVENAAGPSKHQAVALRVNADLSAFYRCSFVGYQDTLTVFMQTKMESLIHPKGWLEWNGTFALDTLYYAEYMNRGPGADTSARVNWPGYHVLTNASDANNFTVLNFVQGDLWLNSSSFPYTLGLS